MVNLSSGEMRGAYDRAVRAVLLERAVFREIAGDPSSVRPALAVAAFVSLAAAAGRFSWRADPIIVYVFARDAIAAFTVWLGAALGLHYAGAAVMPGRTGDANVRRTLRVLGFAAAPGVLMIFGLIPGMTGTVDLIVLCWMLAAGLRAAPAVFRRRLSLALAAACAACWLFAILAFWLIRRYI